MYVLISSDIDIDLYPIDSVSLRTMPNTPRGHGRSATCPNSDTPPCTTVLLSPPLLCLFQPCWSCCSPNVRSPLPQMLFPPGCKGLTPSFWSLSKCDMTITQLSQTYFPETAHARMPRHTYIFSLYFPSIALIFSIAFINSWQTACLLVLSVYHLSSCLFQLECKFLETSNSALLTAVFPTPRLAPSPDT